MKFQVPAFLQSFYTIVFAFLAKIGRRNTPKYFSIEINNGASADVFSLFDEFGAVSDSRRDTSTTDALITTAFPGGIAGLRKTMASNPFYVSQLTYTAESGSTQHGRTFTYIEGDVDGSKNEKPLQAFISNSKNEYRTNDDTIKLDMNVELNGYTDVIIDVLANETITLVFAIEEINRLH